LAIVTTAVERNCEFEWNSHRPLAVEAGVADAMLAAVAERGPVRDPGDAIIVEFVRALCHTNSDDNGLRDEMTARFGEEGFVELSVLVGYYSMMAVFMKACDAC
jgi:4-carboxymuconolactone decarboxylase